MKYSTVRLPETPPTHTQVGPPSPTLASAFKSAIVHTLSLILAWKLRLAMSLGKVVTVLWPGFRRG